MPDATSLQPIDSLTLQTATAALAQGIAAIRSGQTVFDLAALTVVDSSAVAVLLEWQRAARDAGSRLRYTNVPANLQSLATLYGVDEFLTDTPANLQHH